MAEGHCTVLTKCPRDTVSSRLVPVTGEQLNEVSRPNFRGSRMGGIFPAQVSQIPSSKANRPGIMKRPAQSLIPSIRPEEGG